MFNKIENKYKTWSANQYYYHAKYTGVDYLFTENAMNVASHRAQSNPEDIPAEKDTPSPFLNGILVGIVSSSSLMVMTYFMLKYLELI